MITSFRLWEQERDIFGFDTVRPVEQPRPVDDSPIQPLRVSSLWKLLSNKKLNDVFPRQIFDDEMRWGEGTGAIRVKLTPNGNIVIGRMVNDAEGNLAWTCKKVFKVNEEYNGQEEAISHDLLEVLHKISSSPIEKALVGWKGLQDFTKYLTHEVRQMLPGLFVYEDVKTLSESNYLIYFSLRGGGRGVLHSKGPHNAGYSPYMDINVNYDKHEGLMRVVMTTTTIGEEGGQWYTDFPYFDERFSPSQKKEEIAKAVSASLRFY